MGMSHRHSQDGVSAGIPNILQTGDITPPLIVYEHKGGNMNKPKYMEELLKIIFLGLGIAFIIMGLLSLIGVLKPTASSMIQEPTILGIVYKWN